MSNVVIIGGGHAGAEAVTALRQNKWLGNIILISEESYLPYQRPPLSKSYFNDELPQEKLLIKKPELFEKCAADIRLNLRVEKIDREKKQVVLSNRERVDYSHLIIATGTRARQLSLPGSNTAPLHYLRTLNDVKAIKAQVKPASRLLIIGAGYIGLEMAASAIKMGIEVTVLEAAQRVLARVTCKQMSDFYQSIHTAAGVNIRLSTTTEAFRSTDSGFEAVLNDGSIVAFDNAIVGIGVLPNSELAVHAGLEVDNGIVVNPFTQTNDDSIYAIGDVSNHPSKFYQQRLRLESVPNAMEQAKTAAATICGKEKPYHSLPWFWSDQYDIKLQTAGLSTDHDDVIVRGEPSDKQFCIFYLKGAQVIAMDAINSAPDFMKAKQLIPKGLFIEKQKLADLSTPWFK